jgi:NAD(P)-dependent dehydrogenase (short-subunit alcohol dehydrogenase family)
MSGRLDGKTAIVTGAASGLGRAAAEMFAAEGAEVACVDLQDTVETTTKAIEAAGGRALALTADLTLAAEAEEMSRRALDHFGRVDIVYACAGIAGAGTAATVSEENWDRVIAVNLKSKWLSFRYVLPHMIERRRGSVIVQASVGGLIGVPNIFPYAAAKGGCVAMVRQAAVDLGPSGVRVNAIAPGMIPTPLVISSYEKGGGIDAHKGVEEGIRTAGERFPLRRVGTVEDNAYLAVYLASDESSWTTGQTLVVDGGLTVS